MKKTKKKFSLFNSNELMMLFVLIIEIIVFTIMNKNFFSYQNMTNILLAASTVGLLAIGEVYLIIAGGIDLASAHTAAVFGVLVAILINKGIPWVLAVILTVACSVVVGVCNAVLVNVFELAPFIATLAMSNVCNGVAFLIADGKSIPVNVGSFVSIGSKRILGIPIPAIIMVVLILIFGFILARTVFGRSIYMVGGNAEAARLAGLNPKRITSMLYVFSSMIAAFAGVLMTAKMHSGQPGGGSGAEFDAITAAILGGVALTGGTGNMAGCFIGLLIMQCFNNGLTIINVSSFWQIIAKGLLLIFALVFDYIRRKKLSR